MMIVYCAATFSIPSKLDTNFSDYSKYMKIMGEEKEENWWKQQLKYDGNGRFSISIEISPIHLNFTTCTNS